MESDEEEPVRFPNRVLNGIDRLKRLAIRPNAPMARICAHGIAYSDQHIVEHKKPTDTFISVGVISPEIVRQFSQPGKANTIAKRHLRHPAGNRKSFLRKATTQIGGGRSQVRCTALLFCPKFSITNSSGQPG